MSLKQKAFALIHSLDETALLQAIEENTERTEYRGECWTIWNSIETALMCCDSADEWSASAEEAAQVIELLKRTPRALGKPYFEPVQNMRSLIRVIPLPGGYRYCYWHRSTSTRAVRETSDRATIWNPNGGIEWSGINAPDGARIVRMIRNGEI